MNKFIKRIPLLFAIAFCFFFFGCTTYKMSVIEGDFDVTLQQPIRGAEFNMTEHSEVTRIVISTNGYGSQKSKLSNVWTGEALVRDGTQNASKSDYSERIDPSIADLTYIFKEFPLSLQVEWLNKNEWIFYSYGFGLDYMPYGTATVGLNGRFGEVGVATYFGIDFNKASYSYEAISASEPFIQSSPDPEHFFDKENSYQLHLRGGVGAFASFFVGPISLTYAPMLHSPQLWTDELEGRATGYDETDADITFDFPYYFSNYFGLTYTFQKKMQYSAGVTVINGTQLNERLYFGSASIAWLW